jgi:hypothetical protein
MDEESSKEIDFKKEEAKLVNSIRVLEFKIMKKKLRLVEMQNNLVDLNNALYSHRYNHDHGWK